MVQSALPITVVRVCAKLVAVIPNKKPVTEYETRTITCASVTIKIRLNGLPRLFSSPYDKNEIAYPIKTRISVQCPSGPLVLGDRSSKMPAPNPTAAATSGVLRAAQRSVRIKKIENPPAGKLS